jgi:hypothetical protein
MQPGVDLEVDPFEGAGRFVKGSQTNRSSLAPAPPPGRACMWPRRSPPPRRPERPLLHAVAAITPPRGLVVDDDPVVLAEFPVLGLAVPVVELGGHRLGLAPVVPHRGPFLVGHHALGVTDVVVGLELAVEHEVRHARTLVRFPLVSHPAPSVTGMATSDDRANLGELISQLGKVIDDWHVTVLNHDEAAFRHCRDQYRRLTKVIDGLIEKDLR